jgi:hypothetical protein
MSDKLLISSLLFNRMAGRNNLKTAADVFRKEDALKARLALTCTLNQPLLSNALAR